MVSVSVTSLKTAELLILVKACYHLSGNFQLPFGFMFGKFFVCRTVPNLAKFRKTLAFLRSQAVLDSGRAVSAAKIEV